MVVDAGRARRARFDPGSGMSRLVTERVSRAEAEQRRGRAGRVAPGICYRLWARAEEGALPAFAPPEIAVADLAGLALELAVMGRGRRRSGLSDPAAEAAAMTEARAPAARSGRAGRARGGSPTHGQAAGRAAAASAAWRICWSTAGRGAADLAALGGTRSVERCGRRT
ncbi:hypothetical protein PE067_14465 [Paracoccus sp. DMF-8]|uniref:hypothetical protein n=1 Tax=Paracoccus sp. DMF-8 TaxID=3019445 RepID=UPI0023E42D39|nr:hypothetical protein [Paracoccus sp. DMF-8]MDF3607222.1 hypothetical protein [Paracoccus sp. DMF-8]